MQNEQKIAIPAVQILIVREYLLLIPPKETTKQNLLLNLLSHN